MHQCLTALEHASFACPSNEQYLVEVQIQPFASQAEPVNSSPASTNGSTLPVGVSFPAWLVQHIQQAASSVRSPAGNGVVTEPQKGQHWTCMQAGLSVLVNMTHHNPSGCDAVVDSGGLHMAARVLVSSLQQPGSGACLTDKHAGTGKVTVADRQQGILTDRQHAVAHVGTLTAALGLLINLLEESEANRKRLKAMQSTELTSSGNVLQTLCRLMQARLCCYSPLCMQAQAVCVVAECHIASSLSFRTNGLLVLLGLSAPWAVLSAVLASRAVGSQLLVCVTGKCS